MTSRGHSTVGWGGQAQALGGQDRAPRRSCGTSHRASTKPQMADGLSAWGTAVTGRLLAQKKNVSPSPTPHPETNSKTISSCRETYSQETSRSPF